MRHFAIVACLFLVLSVSVIARADNDYDNIWFEERDTNSTTSDTTGSMSTTGSSTTGGSSTQVYDVSLGDQNVTVSIPVTGNHTLKIQFPAIGNFSAKYSGAGADIADYADPDATKPSGVSFKGASFFITLYYPNGSKVEGFTFPEPIIVTIGVDGVSDDDAFYLYDTETETWTDAASTCDTPSTQVVDGNLVVAICHLTQFAVFETITTANLGAKSHNTSGLIAAVIIIPIVIVGVIIALVAWTLLRKPHKRSKSERDLEMEKTEKSSSKRELTKEIESDSDTETDSSADEKPAPKEEKKVEEKKAEPVIELKKATSDSSDDSDTDSSSDSSEREELKKKAEEKKKRESSDTDTDTDTDSDE